MAPAEGIDCTLQPMVDIRIDGFEKLRLEFAERKQANLKRERYRP